MAEGGLSDFIRAGKDAGHRDECHDGLLFPPEQTRTCHEPDFVQELFSKIFWKLDRMAESEIRKSEASAAHRTFRVLSGAAGAADPCRVRSPMPLVTLAKRTG